MVSISTPPGLRTGAVNGPTEPKLRYWYSAFTVHGPATAHSTPAPTTHPVLVELLDTANELPPASMPVKSKLLFA